MKEFSLQLKYIQDDSYIEVFYHGYPRPTFATRISDQRSNWDVTVPHTQINQDGRLAPWSYVYDDQAIAELTELLASIGKRVIE